MTTPPRRVGIVGCRAPQMPTEAETAAFSALLADVRAFVEALPADAVVVVGGPSGVDATALLAALKRGLAVREHILDHSKHNSVRAKLERNTALAADVTELHVWPGAAVATATPSSHDAAHVARSRGVPVTIHQVKP